MAMYTSYFVAADDDFTHWFPGWKRPLDRPVRVKRTSWLTKQDVEVWSWDPDPERPSTAAVVMEAHAVVEITGDYDAYLEARAHPLVKSSPHRCWKGVDVLKIEALRSLLLEQPFDVELEHFPPACIAPPEIHGDITVLPRELTAALARFDDSTIESMAEAWADSGEVQIDDIAPDYAAVVLRGLIDLARDAVRDRKNLHLMTEF